MTDQDFEKRLRRIEEWCTRHDATCDGRRDQFLTTSELLQKSIDKTTQMAEENDRRLDGIEKRIAFAMGAVAILSFVGSILGGALRDLL